MSTLISEKRIDVIDAYKDLVISLETLGGHLRLDAKNGLPAWVQKDEDDITPASDIIISIYQTLTMKKGYEPRESFTLFGLMAASPETLQQVETVNKKKRKLKDAFIVLKEAQRERKIAAAYDEIKGAPLIREALRAAGLARLHIKQSTRQIVTLKEMPARVGFTVSRGSHIVSKLKKADAVELAEKYNNEILAEKIKDLPDKHIPQVRRLASHVRANITYRDRARIKHRPDQVAAYMPILYPYDAEQDLLKQQVIHNGEVALYKLNNDIDEMRLPRGGIIDKSQLISGPLKLYRYTRYTKNQGDS